MICIYCIYTYAYTYTCLNDLICKDEGANNKFLCSISALATPMRVGSLNTAPDLCGCNLCLALARIGSICHTGELPFAAVGFATDRLRVLYGELLDIRTRELLSPPLSGGNQGTPPVAAGGEPQAAGPPREAGSVAVAAPELPPEAPATSGVKKEEGGEKEDNQAPGESQASLDENAPNGEKELAKPG